MKVVRFLFEYHKPLDVQVDDAHSIEPKLLASHAWYYAETVVSWEETYYDYQIYDGLPPDIDPNFLINTKDFGW